MNPLTLEKLLEMKRLLDEAAERDEAKHGPAWHRWPLWMLKHNVRVFRRLIRMGRL